MSGAEGPVGWDRVTTVRRGETSRGSLNPGWHFDSSGYVSRVTAKAEGLGEFQG